MARRVRILSRYNVPYMPETASRMAFMPNLKGMKGYSFWNMAGTTSTG